jgi:hypothetical protein
MHTGKGRRLWLVGLMLLGGLFAVLRLWPSNDPLLERATKVAALGEWERDYFWLSDREFLLFRPTPGTRLGDRLYRHDVVTGQEEPLTALTRLYNQTNDWVTSEEVSPDGKWLLWADTKDHAFAATLDARRLLQWRLEIGFDPVHWEGDSRHWIELVRTYDDKHAVLHDVQMPHSRTRLEFGSADVIGWNDACEERILSERHMLIWFSNGSMDSEFSPIFYDISLNKATKPTRMYNLPLPPGAICSEMEFSSQGDRVALLLRFKRVALFDSWLHRLLPAYKPTPHSYAEIWISRLDGSSMRELAHTEHTDESNPGRNRDQVLNSIHWLPDGKRLSFVYKDALWTVPAN